MQNVGSFLHLWEGFLPPNAIIMGKQPVSSPQSQVQTNLKSKKIFFQVTAEYRERAELRELLSKMIEAMGLSPSDISVGEELQPAQITIRLLGGQNLGQTNLREITTHTLESLQQNTAFKRDTWAHLKTALTLLKP